MPTFRINTLALWPLLLLSACSGSGSSSSTVTPDIGATTLSCADSATYPLTTGMLLNNMWGKASAGAGPWQQCLQTRQKDGRTDYGWFWQWPTRDGLYAYPEILVGRSPWTATPTNDPRFPRTLADTQSLLIEYDVESRSEGKKNLAVEFWFTDSALAAGTPDTTAIKTELMIWSDYSAGMVSATDIPVAVVQIDGQAWSVYVKHNWGDASGTATTKWDLISYLATSPAVSVKYDARKFFQDALDRGLVLPSYVIAGVELGNEISSGSGSTWVKKFNVTTP